MEIIPFIVTREFQGETFQFGLLLNEETGEFIVGRKPEVSEQLTALTRRIGYMPIELDGETIKREEVAGKYMMVVHHLSYARPIVDNLQFVFILRADEDNQVSARFAGPKKTKVYLETFSDHMQTNFIKMARDQAINNSIGDIRRELNLKGPIHLV